MLNDLLQRRLGLLLARIEKTEFYTSLTSPTVSRDVLVATMRYVYLDIASYQPHVTEATFTAVGRMPKHEQLIRTMILQQVEEVEHAAMALRDYARLGGTPDRAGVMTPEAAAVAAVCRFLGAHVHPASYLGYMFIFEALTPIMAARAQRAMSLTGYEATAREFIDLHAVEDVRHTDQVAQMVEGLVAIDPAAADHVLWGFDALAAVYPIPLWSAAYCRAVVGSTTAVV